MPLLAGFPDTEQPGEPGSETPKPPNSWWQFNESRRLTIQSLDGSRLWPFDSKEFIARKGITGLDLVPQEVSQSAIPGMDGTRLDGIKYGPREVFLPIFLGSNTSHLDFLDRRRRLHDILNARQVDYKRTEGTFDLVASAEGQDDRRLRCLYVSGKEGDLSRDVHGSYWEAFGLTLLAVQPYWKGKSWTTPIISQPSGVRWFGIFPGALTASRALGTNVPISVAGNVGSWSEVMITGPAASVTITGPGISVTIPRGLAAGETARIITDPRTRDALFNGTRDWSRVGPNDRYAPIAPGERTISLVLTGTNKDTQAVVSGETLFETAW